MRVRSRSAEVERGSTMAAEQVEDGEESVRIVNRDGTALAAVFRPADDGGSPAGAAVLLCQGLSGVKHLVLPDVARAFAAAGLATLRFDYAGFGESGGEPGWIDPRRRTDDALHALAGLAARGGVDADRLGVYGHSYGGPVAIHVAARDRRVRAVVAVSGPGDGTDMLRALRPSWSWIELCRRVAQDRAAVAAGGAPEVVGVQELLPFSPAFLATYQALRRDGGSSAMAAAAGLGVDRFYLASVDAMVDFHPGDAAARLGGTALLLVHGTDDDVAPVETVEPVYAAAPGPKRLHLVPGAGHNDLDGGEGLAHAVEVAAGWFHDHL